MWGGIPALLEMLVFLFRIYVPVLWKSFRVRVRWKIFFGDGCLVIVDLTLSMLKGVLLAQKCIPNQPKALHRHVLHPRKNFPLDGFSAELNLQLVC